MELCLRLGDVGVVQANTCEEKKTFGWGRGLEGEVYGRWVDLTFHTEQLKFKDR